MSHAQLSTDSTTAQTRIWPNQHLIASILFLLVSLVAYAPVSQAQSANNSCSVVASTVSVARAVFAQNCDVPLVDCDPVGSDWQCAGYQIGSNSPGNNSGGTASVASSPSSPAVTSPVTQPIIQPVIRPVTQPAATSGTSNAANCSVDARTLSGSKALYEQQCSRPRVDCDLIGGQWRCASFRMGASPNASAAATSGSTNNTSSISSTSNAGSGSSANNTSSGSSTGITYGGRFGPPRLRWRDSYSANGRCYILSNFDHGIGTVAVSTPAGSRTVRQIAAAIGAGPGVGNNPIYNDVQCGHGPANNRGDEDVNQCPGRVDQGIAGCSRRGPRWNLSAFRSAGRASDRNANLTTTRIAKTPAPTPVIVNDSPNTVSGGVSALLDGSRLANGDLLSIHHDNAGDSNDGLSSAAIVMMTDYFGLKDSLHVVTGTYYERAPQFYDSNSEPLMRIVYGEEDSHSGWWNAHSRYESAIAATLNRWSDTLRAGKKVWVAEGGASDFTAEVLTRMSLDSSLHLKNINVIQHNAYNDGFTVPSNLAITKNLANHVNIADGNYVDNGTTGLNQQNDAVALGFSNSPNYNTIWDAAFNYLPAINCNPTSQACSFDGSDAVAVLYILGDEQLRDWADFSARYYR